MVEDGVEYHRIGRGLIEELLEALSTDPLLAADGSASSVGSRGISLTEAPKAAFRAPDRSYETPDEPASGVIDLSLDDLADEPDADENASGDQSQKPNRAAPSAVESEP